jgi:hypothetical protein
MFTALAVLAYLLAIGIPVYILYRFGSAGWYWHALAVVAAIALGMVPTPMRWQAPIFDMALGFGLVAMLVWGIGGFMAHPHGQHREKHA